MWTRGPNVALRDVTGLRVAIIFDFPDSRDACLEGSILARD